MSDSPYRFACVVLSSLLAACGGSGENSRSAADEFPPPNANLPVDQPTEMPAYTEEQATVLQAINHARTRTGLTPLQRNPQLDLAAQGHAHYVHLNGDAERHEQTPGKPGFTGARLLDRLIHHPGPVLGEVMGFHREPVQGLLSTIYHRIGLLSPGTTEVGIGIATYFSDVISAQRPVTVINYAQPANPKTHEAGFWVWPYDGASNLPVSYVEAPNPAPDLQTLGYAISVAVNPGQTISTQTFTLNCAGVDVPSRLITSQSDAHGIIPANWVFLQPIAALPYNATCSASFQGESPLMGRFHKTWGFATTQASNNHIQPVLP
ncbi:CAP domain-containing protein [Pusillimonas sp. CC-YST705]|uniref:CAP domain-containing protein n=1 Tax=Mesopusillimonas faecipullorum TaxID=2755040 RepID=A0ABS8CAP5_9BURK|nr:CAP domain-containing protein [Mesopusillimonas faecipullorum]MCB5362927.1 CAP domain-containing protein [Mesopusillimonas faecipullorum]